MGHFSVNCAISHLPIVGGDEAVLIILGKHLNTPYNAIDDIAFIVRMINNKELEEGVKEVAKELKEAIDNGESSPQLIDMYEGYSKRREILLAQLNGKVQFWFGQYDSYGQVGNSPDDSGDLMDIENHFYIRRDVFDWVQEQKPLWKRETPSEIFEEAKEGMSSIIKLVYYMYDMRIPFGYGINQFGAQDPDRDEYQMNLDKAKFIASITEKEMKTSIDY